MIKAEQEGILKDSGPTFFYFKILKLRSRQVEPVCLFIRDKAEPKYRSPEFQPLPVHVRQDRRSMEGQEKQY